MSWCLRRIEQALMILDCPETSTMRAFARLWFFERQAALESEVPPLRVELEVDPHNADIAGGQVDIGIRYGRGNWRDLEVKSFLPEMLYPVAHPTLADAYIARSGLVRVSRRQVESPLRYYIVHAKGQSRPEVLALIERMQKASAGASS